MFLLYKNTHFAAQPLARSLQTAHRAVCSSVASSVLVRINAKTPLRGFWSYWADSNRRPADYEWSKITILSPKHPLYCAKLMVFRIKISSYPLHTLLSTIFPYLTRQDLGGFYSFSHHIHFYIYHTHSLSRFAIAKRYSRFRVILLIECIRRYLS